MKTTPRRSPRDGYFLGGLDSDYRAKLYFSADGKIYQPVDHAKWMEVHTILGAKPGEMIQVTLSRLPEEVRNL